MSRPYTGSDQQIVMEQDRRVDEHQGRCAKDEHRSQISVDPATRLNELFDPKPDDPGNTGDDRDCRPRQPKKGLASNRQGADDHNMTNQGFDPRASNNPHQRQAPRHRGRQSS